MGSLISSLFSNEVAVRVVSEVAAQKATSYIREKYNPDLTDRQAALLQTLFVNALCAARDRRGRQAGEFLGSAIALAVPDERNAQAYRNLLDFMITVAPLLVEQFNAAKAEAAGSSSQFTYEPSAPTMPVRDADRTAVERFDSTLTEKFGIERSKLGAFPPGAKEHLVTTLSAEDVQCPISLESLVEANGKISRGVVAVVQSQNGASHVYLFKRYAIDQWFATSRTKTNPLNREPVRGDSVFLLS